MLTITEKIQNHIHAYANAGYEITVYRLTGAEHKELLKEAESLMNIPYTVTEVGFIPEPFKKGRIARYMDVEMEIVQIIEEYI